MIVFKTLSWRNFLSTGNQPTVIQLDKAPTTLVLGPNGSGKSTMLDALCYVLFKKPFRKIKKDQIVNTINGGDCVVEVEFEIGTHEYKVRRGINKDFMELLVDGAPPKHLEAVKKDDQKYLEEDILKVDYDAFTQVVILGNAKYTPFMQLTTPQRRSFIEQILDIGVFSTMNEILGNRQKGVKIQLDEVNKNILVVKEQITLVQGFISKLKAEQKKANQDSQRQIDEQNATIDELAPAIKELTAKISVANDELGEKTDELYQQAQIAVEELTAQRADTLVYEDKIRKLTSLRSGITSNVSAAQARIDFYEQNSTCKSCKQEIAATFRDGIVVDQKAKIQEYNTALEKLSVELKKWSQTVQDTKAANQVIQTKIDKMNADNTAAVRKLTNEMQASIRALTGELQQKQSTTSAARQFIKKLQEDMKKTPGNVKEQEDKLVGFESRLATLETEKDEAVETRHFYDVCAVLLKDNGIKAAIIKQYLPAINKLVNKYLADMDFFLSFQLDENFDETFKSRHRDTLQYNSFSEGEKLRIDLSLLFAWRDIARLKNSCSTNLLILDEVIDSSLDHNGTDFFIKLLNELGSTSNVFVISHKNDAALDKFRDVVRFEKKSNFSHIIEEV